MSLCGFVIFDKALSDRSRDLRESNEIGRKDTVREDTVFTFLAGRRRVSRPNHSEACRAQECVVHNSSWLACNLTLNRDRYLFGYDRDCVKLNYQVERCEEKEIVRSDKCNIDGVRIRPLRNRKQYGA